MEMFYLISHFFIIFGGGISFMLSAIELVKKDRSFNSGIFFFGALGVFLVSLGLLVSGYWVPLITKLPVFVVIFFIALYSLGPLILLFGYNVTRSLYKNKFCRMYFLPSFIVVFLGIYLYFAGEASRKVLFTEAFIEFKVGIIYWFLLFGSIQTFFFYSYLLYYVFLFQKKYKMYTPHMLYPIVSTSVIGVILVGAGYFSASMDMLVVGGDICTIATMMAFLFPARYPKFLIDLKYYVLKEDYKRDQLKGVNIESVKKRIDFLVKERKIFLDENLKLHNMAEELLIAPRMLSSILNKNYKMNFNEFLNYYRIEEAKKLLIKEKGRSILSIAYDVGFNTKSAFNYQFLRIVKKTPKKFRNEGNNLTLKE